MRCVQGGPETGRDLAGHADLDGPLFTGSARAGLALHRQFAETPHKILALEMGGNNPLVVRNAPDVQAAAAIAIQSAYMSAGQRCTAARRLIVEDGKQDELVEAIVKLIDRIIVGHPHAKPAPFMGPVIDNEAAGHLEDAFIDLTGKGGRHHELDRKSGNLPFMTPLIGVTGSAVPTRNVRPGPAGDPGQGFDAALAE